MNTSPSARRTQHAVLDWRHHAACQDEDPELFYLPGMEENNPAAQRQIAEAKSVCQRCPVQPECLTWALRVGDGYGVLGGMSAGERKVLRRKDAAKLPQPEDSQPEGKTKRCELCGQKKSVTEFTLHRGRGDGLAARCKECHTYVRHQQRLQGPGQHRPRRKVAV